jgi:hypothetical protein
MLVEPIIIHDDELHKLDTGIAAGEQIMIRLKLSFAAKY